MNKKVVSTVVAVAAVVLAAVWTWQDSDVGMETPGDTGTSSALGAPSAVTGGGAADVLAFTPGPAGNGPTPPAGSWFGVELVPQMMVYTGLQAGPDGGIILGKPQKAAGSHAGGRNGKEAPGLDAPWVFFSSTGMHYTIGSGITRTGDGRLDFRAWRWTWNGIEEIDLGQGGFAKFTWSGKHGEPFQLDYSTTIPAGESSGFGGSKYILHLEGIVKPLGATAG